MTVRPKTNFSRYSHGHLYQMLHQGDETTPRSAADSWDGVGARLHEQAGNLESRLASFREQWQGGAAEQYQLMITDLSAGLRRIGDAMFSMRDLAHDTGDSLVKAKTRMPAPVEVPDVSPATMYLATTPLDVDPLASTQDVATLRQRQSVAAAELDSYQDAVAASNSAHAQAVVVMNDLAVEYLVAGDGIPVTPQAAGARPVPAEDEPTSWQQLTEDTEKSEEDTEEGNGPPVFGSMFTAGVAAAAAATAGRLGMRIAPKVPDWAKKDKAEPEKATPAEPGKTTSGLGGGLGGKFGGGGGGGGIAPPAPAAHPGMAGGPVAGQAAAALRAAAGAAGAGAMGMPFMPMMPFAPMGAGGANSRRIPPWLTETEDVWGESSVITPPVLGEDPPARADFPY